jgi:hypothetical protein
LDFGRELPALILAWREASLDNPGLVALLACF